jgi:hypothetical protein
MGEANGTLVFLFFLLARWRGVGLIVCYTALVATDFI